uniref:Cyclin N-terminal domain-containing protein n=1 Tax=Romanomermis culicivorax TaxID=13658 RepID=A0A915HPP0_ROMCU
MTLHFNALYTYALQQSELGNHERNWSILEDKMCSQVTLRALSCVQVASKLHSNSGLSITTLKELLRKLGFCYTTDNILNSELRILKTLNFKVNFLSPLDYVEILLKLLEDQNLLNCDANRCFHYCVYVLDLILLNKDEIYTKIIEYSLKTTVFDSIGENLKFPNFLQKSTNLHEKMIFQQEYGNFFKYVHKKAPCAARRWSFSKFKRRNLGLNVRIKNRTTNPAVEQKTAIGNVISVVVVSASVVVVSASVVVISASVVVIPVGVVVVSASVVVVLVVDR